MTLIKTLNGLLVFVNLYSEFHQNLDNSLQLNFHESTFIIK